MSNGPTRGDRTDIGCALAILSCAVVGILVGLGAIVLFGLAWGSVSR